ncbi:MAG TPA: sugar phosphate isomerase/epimerase [Longimicrobiales bacterium]|nr:sugar phosphate isomerase/epimerase [Longimicrobiales bacterium]
MDRRDFLHRLAALATAPAAFAPGQRSGPAPRRLQRIGVQLYTLRELAARDLERTLAAIAAAGYGEVELLTSFGNYGHAPAEVRRMLDAHGLRAPSTHVGAGHIAVNLEQHLEEATTLGHEYLVVASLGTDESRTLDDYRAWADTLNRAAETARRAGVWLGFHNHAGDFVPRDGRIPYDVFVERTDPALVRLQLDIGNLASTGRDPLDYLRRYGARYWQFHVKDPARPPATGDTVLGQGALDLPRILRAIDRPDEKHFYVEQEQHAGDPLDSIRRDYAYLSALEL